MTSKPVIQVKLTHWSTANPNIQKNTLMQTHKYGPLAHKVREMLDPVGETTCMLCHSPHTTNAVW